MTETPIPTVHEAWLAVKADVGAIAINESGEGIRYKFRGVNSVLDAFGPVLLKHGVTVFPSSATGATRDFTNKGGNVQHEALVTVGYTVVGPAGDSFTGQVIGGAADASDKAVPQAMSVALRTFFLQAGTVPTQDPEPDETVVDRANPDDADAMAQGWSNANERATVWAAGVEAMAGLPGERSAPVVAWGKTLDPPLSPTSLTPDIAAEWKRQMDRALHADPDELPLEPDVGMPDAEVKGDDPSFDRADAWAMLYKMQGSLTAAGIDKVQKWLDAEGITAESLTKDQASAWFTMMAPMEREASAAKPENGLKAQGWKSKAEREKTWDSLTARTAELEPGLQMERGILEKFAATLTRDTFTKADAEKWLGMLEESLQSPM